MVVPSKRNGVLPQFLRHYKALTIPFHIRFQHSPPSFACLDYTDWTPFLKKSMDSDKRVSGVLSRLIKCCWM